MNRLFRAAILVATVTGCQIAGTMGASAEPAGLLQYAQDPSLAQVEQFKPVKVAGWRVRKRNRAFAAGVAVGVSAAIVAPRRVRAVRYPGARYCRNLRIRCNRGRASSCRNWNRRCR